MKAPKKVDGVVDAVHYDASGQMALLRLYPRRGITYVDRILLSRPQVVELLGGGKKLYTGQRKETMGYTFDLDLPLRLVKQDGKDFIQVEGSTNKSGDDLGPAPSI